MNKNLQSDLQQVFNLFRLPGMAVAVLQKGEVVFNQGFGYANLETQQPFTDETVGLVASVTKSFTAGLVGCLVDRGLVEWTKPVRDYIPTFKMMDPFATKEVTLEDMLCHRTGLPYHENMLAHGVGRELANSGREFRADLLRRMAHFDPSSSFRSHFQYQDIVYSCVGAIVEEVTGRDYEELVDEYLLQPLGMAVSTYDRAKARESGKLAQSYALIEDAIQPIAFCDTRYIAPSAGLYSTVQEMTQWLKLQLSGGRYNNKEIISTESLAWIHGPHMLENRDSGLGAGITTYGQGWRQNYIHGELVVTHGGSFNGHRTFVGFIPERDAGVVVFTNLNLTEGSSAAGMIALDHIVNVENADARLAFFQQRTHFFRNRDKEEEQAFGEGRNLQNPPTHRLEAYQGNYTHPGYGKFVVELRGETLYQSYDGRTFPLVPYNGNTFASHFQSTENHLLNMTFTFETTAPDQATQSNIVALRVPLIPDIPTPRFTKV
ncbi:MAG: serine hydrolase [Chloroflexota bacterium]